MKNRIHRFSLAKQALLFSLVAGVFIWGILEWLQSEQLQKLLNHELTQRLAQQQKIVHQRFYSSVERHLQMAKQFADSEALAFYLIGVNNGAEVKSAGKPNWVPDVANWRGIILPAALIVYDKNMKHSDTWKVLPDITVPDEIIKNPARILDQSFNRTLVTDIEGRAVIIASAPVIFKQQEVLGYISIYLPIDDHFLNLSLVDSLPQYAGIVLFSGSFGDLKVEASTDSVRFPPGKPANEFEKDYLFGGRGYFDQGDWSLQSQLSVLIPRSILQTLNADITGLGRQQRLISAIIFVLLFTGIMFFITYRLRRIVSRINQFARVELNTDLPDQAEPDSIEMLQNSVEALSKEVAQSREALKLKHVTEKRSGELEVLQTTTDILQVGVLKYYGEKWHPLNRAMVLILNQTGCLDSLTNTGSDQIDITDNSGKRRVFELIHTNSESGSLLLVKDITELAIKTEELTHMALYDSLTGLPNRALFHDRLEQNIIAATRDNVKFSLLLLDLDNFKDVNDTFGHSAGDKLLCEVSCRFNRQLRGKDTLARLGGDEFSILLPGTDLERAQMVAAKLLKAQRQPFQLRERLIDVGVSIGIVCFPQHGELAEQLVSRADMAMYQAKQRHLGQFVYQSKLDSSDHDRLALLADLRQALVQNELILYYQPQVSLENLRTVSWEALVRWDDAQRGLVQPENFIPVAEQTGLIRDVTRFVIEQAIADCALWNQQGVEGGVSVNLSTYDFSDVGLVDRITSLLKKYQLAGNLLTLEITETVLMQDPVMVGETLEQLHELEINLSVDDFGTGYSSLSYLKQLPINEIKIDQIFIRNMENDQDDAAIVHAVISLAKNLNMEVVAEGVEDEATLSTLGRLQCTLAQGFYFSRPIPFDMMSSFSADSINCDWSSKGKSVRSIKKIK